MSHLGQQNKQSLQGQQLCTPCEAASIKQALAIAIVRQKRKCSQEADEWRLKAQDLASSNAAIKAWATSVLQNTGTTAQDAASWSAASMTIGTCMEQTNRNHIFLPPLTTRSGDNMQQHPSAPALQASYTSLQQQVLLTAEAASCTATDSVLSGKAAALSNMLITNVQMLRQLQPPGKPTDTAVTATAASAFPLSASLQQAPVTDVMPALGSFIKETLVRVPNSSLRLAYMQQCAALLAALLAHSTSDASQQQQQHATQLTAVPAQTPLQKLLHKQQSGSQMDSVAIQTVELIRLLLQLKTSKSAVHELLQQQPTQEKSHALDAAGYSNIQQSATAMLQQLSSFPGTALLMALAVAQQLQLHVQQLLKANIAAQTVRLGALGSNSLAAADQAQGIAAETFEASHQLIEDLEQATQQLPVWAVALSNSSWTVKAMEDLVAMTASMYSSCPGLQQHQCLLADKLCRLAASLATALQHFATAADAPGMRSGSGAALRSACGSLCMQLRDVFMPAGLQQ